MTARIVVAMTALVVAVFIALGVAGAVREPATATIIALAALAVAVALSWLLADGIRRPLARVTSAMRSVTRGDLSGRLPETKEYGEQELVEAFNRMAESLEGQIAEASRERNRFLAAINSSSDAVIAVDEAGRVAFCNRAGEQLFGMAVGDMIGSPFAWLLAQEQVIEALRASREQERPQTVVIEVPGDRYLEVTTTPIEGAGEWAALAVFHDLTEVKRVERVRRDFVANVSHELRTPLASIKAVIETLQRGALNDPDAAQDFLERADNEVDRLALLVVELLELSRIESGDVPMRREPVDLSKVIAAVVERLRPQAENAGLQVTAAVDSELPAPQGDGEQLERVLLNLLHNAIKFTPAGGSIHVAAAVNAGSIDVSVRDTGTGIDPRDITRIFERFYKGDRAREKGGTGLGLAIAKHIVEAHGGSIRAESEPGRGATITFSLPV